jgi:DNA repair protein RecO (recombination protein O)
MSREQPLLSCFVLHARKYRDTSLLVDVFSREQGRFTVVARGARSAKSRFSYQPFVPVLMRCFGRGELKTAAGVEAGGVAYQLVGRNLMIGMYANELLYRLLGKYVPIESLYDRYETLLLALQADASTTLVLRRFELSLLADLGYGVSFDIEAETGDPIDATASYGFRPENGFYRMPDEIHEVSIRSNGTDAIRAVAGEDLLAIADGRLDSANDRVARWVVRQSIDQLLDGKPLNSRKLFAGMPRS